MTTNVLARLPEQGAPDLLFLLFHGVGASAEHMAVLAQRLAQVYPQAAVLCIDAPDEFDAAPGRGGRQWFSIQGIADENRAARVAAAMPRFVATVRALQLRFTMDWPRTALFGFSQGAIMALASALRPEPVAARVIAIAGRFARLPEAPLHDGSTLHLLHGKADAVMPYSHAIDGAMRLKALGTDFTADVLPFIGHELHPDLVELAVDKLQHHVPARLWLKPGEDNPAKDPV